MIERIEAKKLLQKFKSDSTTEWFGVDYNMNLYRGCCHGCIYCDSRSSCYQIENFDRVRVKAHTQEILRSELRGKRTKGVVGIGAMSDPYNPFEKTLCVTRAALGLLAEFGFGVSLDTKSALVTRDIDLLRQISCNRSAIVKLTITTADDDLSQIIEPHADRSSKRFEAIRRLSRAGIFCGVLLTPMLPFLTDTEENIWDIVRLSYENGARFVYCLYGMTLRDNQREYYYDRLDEHFPGLKGRYMEAYGNSYGCSSPHAPELKAFLEHECRKYGLLYRMEDIIREYKRGNEFEQLSLF